MVVIGKVERGLPRIKKTQQWRLITSPVEHNDRPKLKLPGAWEP